MKKKKSSFLGFIITAAKAALFRLTQHIVEEECAVVCGVWCKKLKLIIIEII